MPFHAPRCLQLQRVYHHLEQDQVLFRCVLAWSRSGAQLTVRRGRLDRLALGHSSVEMAILEHERVLVRGADGLLDEIAILPTGLQRGRDRETLHEWAGGSAGVAF